MIKVLERKTNLEGTAALMEDGSYKVQLEGKEEKTVAESTFKRNYKKIKDEVASTEDEIDLTEMAMNPEIIENNLGGNEVMENLEVAVVEENNELVEMAMNPEIIEEVVVNENVEEVKEEAKTNTIVELTEEELQEISLIIQNITPMIEASVAETIVVEKNTKSIKLMFSGIFGGIELNINTKIKYAENIANQLKENIKDKEIVFENKYKRPNPGAFKAKMVKVVYEGEEIIFDNRKIALNWVEKLYEDGKLDKKPTYYQVKKAIESDGEYLGIKWSERF